MSTLTEISLWGVRNRIKRIRRVIAERRKNGEKSPVASSYLDQLCRIESYLNTRLAR